MPQEKKRAQRFYEVGNGRLAAEAQGVYESIQQIALEHKQTVTMTLKIIVTPPMEEEFGSTQFTLTHTQPTTKSRMFTTRYEGGVATIDGDSIDAILQTSFLDPKSIPENQR